MDTYLGVDVGGSSVKAAPVNLSTGQLTRPQMRVPTPAKSTPGAIAEIVNGIVAELADDIGDAAIGLAVPAPVRRGRIPFMANLHQDWVGLEADAFFEEALGRPAVLLNDADAAGLAELRFGAARGHLGLVIVTTLGTGIGSAITYRGMLIPNSELGHLEIGGYDAETRAASSVKDLEELSYEVWASERLVPYYKHVAMHISPDLLVNGGGVSQDWDRFAHLLALETPCHPALLRNDAGIIGAAVAARERAGDAGSLAAADDPLPAR